MQLIVLGMHRSGTSVLARLLNLMGAYFGPEGIGTGANQENPRGFWERRDVRELNDMVLHSIGCDWNRVAGFDLAAVPEAVLADFRKRAGNIVLQMDAYRPWMLKEPRLMLLLPLWRELLHSAACVQIYRNPVEVASSLKTRNQIPMETGLALWEFYVRRSLAAAEGLPATVVSHRELITDPSATVASLLSSLQACGVSGLRLPTPNEIEAFVVDELYREREGADELQPYLKAPQVKLFRALVSGRPLRPAGETPDAGQMETLRAYEASLPPLQVPARPKPAPPPDARVANAVTQLVEQLRRREGQSAEVEQQRQARLDAALSAHQATLAELVEARAEGRRLADDLSARDRRIRELEQQWKADLQRRDKLATDLQARDQEVGSLSAKADGLSSERDTLASERDALVSERDALASERDALVAERDALASERDALLSGRDSLEAELGGLRERVARTDGELERREREAGRWRQRIAAADTEIAQLREGRDRLAREVERVNAALAASRKSLAEAGLALAGEERRRADADENIEIRIEEITRLTRALMAQDQRVSQLARDLEAANERESVALDELSAARVGIAEASAAADEAVAMAGNVRDDLEAAARELVAMRGTRGWRAASALQSTWSRLATGRSLQVPPPLWARSLLRDSDLFDAAWYLERYPDVALSGMDAIDHYLAFGAAEGRDPGEAFDTAAWRARHPREAAAGINPLVHALLHGTPVDPT